MKYFYVLLVFAAVYLGLIVLSSSLRLSNKILYNIILGLPAIHIFNLVGRYMGITIDINLFAVVVAALCGPVGIIILLVLRLFGA